MNVFAVTNVAIPLTKTPFAPGFQAVFFNNSGSAATLQGSDNGTDYTTVVNAAATGTMTAIASLPKYVKLSGALSLVYILQGGN